MASIADNPDSLDSNTPPPVTATTTATSDDQLDNNQLKLEERKLALEELKEKHQYDLALKKELFNEEQIDREYKRQLKMNNENWFKSNWRPMAAWIYLIIVFMDFVGFPLLIHLLWSFTTHLPTDKFIEWTSLTLTNGGIFHMAMGAIIGVTAWSKSSERIAAIKSPTPFNEPS